jgi:hypothetical protein
MGYAECIHVAVRFRSERGDARSDYPLSAIPYRLLSP